MLFPLNLFDSSPSLDTTEASKRIRFGNHIWHLSFWHLWFSEEIDRSHCLFCFKTVSFHFLKMGRLLLINLLPGLYHWWPHELVFSPQNLCSVSVAIFILVSALQNADTVSAKRGARTPPAFPACSCHPEILPPSTYGKEKHPLIMSMYPTDIWAAVPKEKHFLYIINITHALGTKSKTKFPLKSVNTLSRETCPSNHRLTCEWQRLKSWPWLICVFRICHTGVSAIAQPPKERHAQSFPWPTETFSVSVLAAGCNSICYGIHA